MFYKAKVYELYYSKKLNNYTYKYLDSIIVSDFTISLRELQVKEVSTSKKIPVKMFNDFCVKPRIVDSKKISKSMKFDLEKYGSVPVMFEIGLTDEEKVSKKDVINYIDNFSSNKFKLYCDKVSSIDDKFKKSKKR